MMRGVELVTFELLPSDTIPLEVLAGLLFLLKVTGLLPHQCVGELPLNPDHRESTCHAPAVSGSFPETSTVFLST